MSIKQNANIRSPWSPLNFPVCLGFSTIFSKMYQCQMDKQCSLGLVKSETMGTYMQRHSGADKTFIFNHFNLQILNQARFKYSGKVWSDRRRRQKKAKVVLGEKLWLALLTFLSRYAHVESWPARLRGSSSSQNTPCYETHAPTHHQTSWPSKDTLHDIEQLLIPARGIWV